jgi:hypothetical protein
MFINVGRPVIFESLDFKPTIEKSTHPKVAMS